MTQVRHIDLTNAAFLKLAANGAPIYEIRVFDTNQASAVWNDYRDHHAICASDMKTNCGNIVDLHDEVIARVSYNGRVWTLDGKPADGMTASEWIASCSVGVAQ